MGLDGQKYKSILFSLLFYLGVYKRVYTRYYHYMNSMVGFMVGFKGEGKMKDSSTNTNTNNEEERKMENQLKEAREAGRMEVLATLMSYMDFGGKWETRHTKEVREFLRYEVNRPNGFRNYPTWEETQDIIYNAECNSSPSEGGK